jgi:gliding motility-associated-like protein
MKLFTKAFQVLLLVASLQQTLFSQSCPTVNAQAGTGASTTICSGQCASLTATVVPVNATTTYSVGSVAYSPFAFTGGTAVIGNVDDVWSSPVNIGFNFCYFGSTFNQLLLGSNGEITFDLSLAAGPEFFSVNQTLPDITEHPVNTICGAYRDIDASDTSMTPKPSINYYVSGTAPCRVFVANWSDVPLYRCQTPASTFQVVLHESTNIIEVFIQNSSACATWQTGRGIIGIQDGTGTTAVAPATRNTLTAWTATNEAWQFMPTGVPNYTVNWAGSDGFTATGLTAAPCPTATTNYTATMNVANCGGGTSTYTSAVQVSVTPTPTLTATASPTAICRGSSTTLTANGATSYTWSPGGATTASISVTPTVSTTYTVRGSNGSCVTTQTVFVKVNLSTTFTATSNPNIICSSGSATLTGTGASTYTWNPGALTGNTVAVSPTVTTQYTVVSTNSLGCNNTRTVNLTVSTSPTITATSSSTTVCAGSTVSLSGSGGTSYTWTPGSLVGATVVVTPTANTTYTIRGRNAAGCTATNTISITTTPGITVTASASPTIICRGAGSTLTATGASSYTWNPGALTGNTVNVTPTVTTVYSVTGSDLGCTNTKTVSVTVSVPNIVATKIPNTSVCAGNSATLSATGAVTYTWNPGAIAGSSVAITPSATTIYTVTGTNALGCTGTRTINVVVAPNPTITASASPTSICAGTSATLTASGASTFTWTPGPLTGSTVVVTPTTSTTYTIRGRNSQGCISNNTLSLNVTPAVTVTPASSPSIICSGSSSTLSATGATSYTWNPGALTGSSVTVNPTVTTTYSVTGVNALGCTNTKTVSVSVSTININATSNPTILCSSNTATLTASGASTYTWNPGTLTGASVTVTPASTTIYTVTGTNSVGCIATQTLNLGVGTTPTIGVSASGTVCEGSITTLTATGGTSYTWNPGALTGSSVSVNPSSSIIYTVTGGNASGCTSTNTVAITVNPTPTITATSDPIILCGGETATLSASGASTYTWNPGAMGGATLTVSPTVTTVYTVSATSSLGCAGSGTVNLKVSPNPTVTTSASPTVVCSGNSSTLTAGGAASYTWNPGALTGNSVVVNPTVSTTYSVTGNNGLGCIATETISITVNANPTITASSSATAICSGQQATLTANGAASYTWNPGALSGATVAVTPTATTTYTVDGDSGTGCITSQTVTVVIAMPSVSISATSTVLCAPGSITLTASGGSTYTWSPVASLTASVTDSPTVTTTYTVTSDNGIGCIGSQTITVNVNSMPSLTVSAASNTICAGSTTTLNASGASTYTWNPGGLTGASVVVTPTTSITYTVDGDNGLGCVSSQTIDITTTPGLTLTPASTSNSLCAGSPATLTIGGASTYTWNPGALTGATVVVTPSTTTTYTVNADNGAGCTGTATLAINVNAIPSISISATSTLLCSSGSVTLTASGATTYTWMPLAAVTATVSDNPSATTTYTVSGDNGAGCIGTQTITVNVSTMPTVTASASSNIICAGSTATLTTGGASTYTWNPGAITGTMVTVTPTVTTTYTVDGDNGAGCIASETITINVNALPSLSVTASSTLLCSAGSITLTASGGTTYTWSPGGANTASVVDNPTITTTYTVLSDNATGCIGTETITVNVGTAPSVTITAMPVGTICAGTTATLTASGAASYTWNPTAATTTVITDSPATTTTYTVTGDNGFGCTATNTFVLNVASGSSITAMASPTAACANSTINLSASGATTYTWLPMGTTGTSVSATPSVSTTYTALGDNGTCIATATVFVNITSPQNVTATVSGDITCLTPTVNLFGNTTSSPVVYLWTGPNSYTSTAQNPTDVTEGGLYTLGVIDLISGCISTTTVSVVTNTAIPGLVATTSGSIGCSGTVTLSAASTTTNTLTYAWSGPSSFTSAVQSPTVASAGDYTVSVNDALTGCNGTSTVTVGTATVTPTLTATASGSLTCIGDVTLTASSSGIGTITYTWSGPSSFTSAVQNPTTTMAGDYTVSVTDGSTGCTTTTMVSVGTNTVGPNLTATVSSSLGCVGTVTLNAASASTNTLSYVWLGPASYTASVQSPTTSAAGDYTVAATDMLTGCVSAATITVGTNTVTPTLTATVSNSLGCTGSVTLTASSTSTNALTYAWSGPSSFTSAVQSPTINIAGDYTVTLNDLASGCSTSTVVSVGSNSVIPVVGIAVPGPQLGCNTTVTLSVITAPTSTLTFDWSGPSSFTSTAQTPTTGVAGDYTVTVTDVSNGCQNTVAIAVGFSTVIPVYSATIIPATCTGSLSNNDGTILISGNSSGDTYDISQAATYTGTATYATANTVPLGGVLTSTLVNPVTATPYTIRVFSSNGCFKDTTVLLTPVSCTIVPVTTLGMTKAVGTPTFVNNSAYNVTYTVVATNVSSGNMTDFSIIDDLNNTFPLPTTFSVITPPVVTSLNSSLTINPGYDGSLQTDLLSPLTSTLGAGKKDTIVFTVQINPNGFFGPFNNSAAGSGTDSNGVAVADSSNAGFAWDPDADGDPTNNDIPTTVTLNARPSIGVAKSGSATVLDDKTIDVTYVITVKNLGNDTLRNVQVLDTLRIPAPAQFSIKSGPSTSSGIAANSNYNGISDIRLLDASLSKLAPGQSETITFVVNITPNAVSSVTNSAIGLGLGSQGPIVRDTSNNGNEPDPNGNLDPTENGENIPTVVALPDVNLFIPEVFTPDGDGRNDFFVIKGIEGRTVKLTVFNRWGNKVYNNDAYDNTWSGPPNTGGLTIGSGKLPQGTYYYIVEFEDGEDDPVNGYVVLQY